MTGPHTVRSSAGSPVGTAFVRASSFSTKAAWAWASTKTRCTLMQTWPA